MIKLLRVCLLLWAAAVLCVATAALAIDVNVGRATCGTTIPIDSQWLLDPAWSYQRLALGSSSRGTNTAETDMYLGRMPISAAMADVLRTEAGMNPRSVAVFELGPRRQPADDCTVYWRPLQAAMSSVEATAARVLILDAPNTLYVCAPSTEVEVILHSAQTTSVLLPAGTTSGAAHSLSFSTKGLRWPVEFRVPSNCTVLMLLLVNRQGTIREWYVWIPATVYTAVMTLLVAAVVVFSRDLSAGMIVALVALLFFGYLGSCVGLVVELLVWQTALGRMFPFPDAVTLYCCLPIYYMLLFALLLVRLRYRGILFHAMLRLSVYGLNCALCCGYWIAGYIVLGSLTLLQFLLSNLFLSIAYSYFVITLERSGLCGEPLSNAVGFLWVAPLTPFAPCALMYYDLYAIEKNDRLAPGTAAAVKEAVAMYNILTSFPLLLLQNVWGIALLAAATAYHMPFAVSLFAVILLSSVHFVLLVEQYGKMYRRWRHHSDIAGGNERGPASSCSTFFSCFSCWGFMWLSVGRCVRNGRERASAEADAAKRLFATVSPSGERTVRMSPESAHYAAERATPMRTVGNEMTNMRVSARRGDERVLQNDDYWPTSIGL
ncbi:hypothetical protein DQ04_08441010 [Trypanosoma grayi]|uniref:hypothetical protein n=1 Tax=Trypanosoma grayi TaxID=71804 RepID=UPI0004F48F3E|nr:hypothetical protein DQ04_08441010 [Trypanosoma grayi]KEG07931.1 hypothetical protein DQ04_08441010 [Trypanosoma grayi]